MPLNKDYSNLVKINGVEWLQKTFSETIEKSMKSTAVTPEMIRNVVCEFVAILAVPCEKLLKKTQSFCYQYYNRSPRKAQDVSMSCTAVSHAD